MDLRCVKKPITAMVAASGLAQASAVILNARWHGADAFYIQLELLPPEEQTEEKLRELFSQCAGKPVIVTAYRQGDPTLTDEERAELLLTALKAGASILDIMGDLFHPETDQLTMDTEAVQRQKELIEKIHGLGGQVLISTHVSRFYEPEEVYAAAREQESRGADYVKIVSKSLTEEQLLTNLQIAAGLKHQIRKPYLFLGNGPFSRTLRLVGPSLGVCMYLCVENFGPLDFRDQPRMDAAAAIRGILES